MGRQQKLIEKMQLAIHEAVIIHNPSNMFYLSGYTGEGLVVIAHGLSAIVTDFRYTEQAQNQASDYSCHMTTKDLSANKTLAELLSPMGVTKVYFEDDFITVKAFSQLQSALHFCSFEALGGKPEQMREIKDADELSLIEKACAITSDAFDYIITVIKEGMTEKEIALMLEAWMFANGADALAFSTIVAAGKNGSLPHAVPGEYRVTKGDMITLDYGAKYKGYCADMTRTVAVGEPDETMRKVYQTVYEAQAMAEKALQKDKWTDDIDAVARDYIDSMGYAGRFGHGLGHSLGIDIHEIPRLSAACHETVKAGHVLTVEPGIYLPGIGGVRIENTCIIKENGTQALTYATRELIIINN
jgi:Xaa-Pro aminopeptidase